MINNLLKLYIFESFTLISFIILTVISSVLNLELVLGIIGIFTMFIFVIWFFTSRLIIRLLVDDVIDDTDGSNLNDK